MAVDIMALLTVDKKRKPRLMDPEERIKFFSFGSLILDMAYNGIPRGRVTEIFGAPNAGKTLMAMLAAKWQVDNNNYVLWLDQEQVFDHLWAKTIGLDTSKKDKKGRLYFQILQPNNAEEALEIVKRVSKTGAFHFIVLDSVAALNPQSEEALAMDKSATIGLVARMLTRISRICAPLLRMNPLEPALFLINQTRDNMDPYSRQTNTPGGKAIRFFGSLRLELLSPKDIPSKDGMDVLQMNFRVICRKTKVGVFRRATFTVTMDKDEDGNYFVNQPVEAFEIAKRYGVFQTRKGEPWTGKGIALFEGQELGASAKAIVTTLSTDYDTFTAVYAACLEAIRSGRARVDIDPEEGDDAPDGPDIEGEFADSEDLIDDRGPEDDGDSEAGIREDEV